MDGWIVLALCSLVFVIGCGFGYWTAHTDIERLNRDHRTQ